MEEIKKNRKKMLTLILRGKGGSGVKKNVTNVFSDPENLFGHNRLSLSLTAEFRTRFLRNAKTPFTVHCNEIHR